MKHPTSFIKALAWICLLNTCIISSFAYVILTQKPFSHLLICLCHCEGLAWVFLCLDTIKVLCGIFTAFMIPSNCQKQCLHWKRKDERLRHVYLWSISTWRGGKKEKNYISSMSFRLYRQVGWKTQAISTVLNIRTDAGKVTRVPLDVLIHLWH